MVDERIEPAPGKEQPNPSKEKLPRVLSKEEQDAQLRQDAKNRRIELQNLFKGRPYGPPGTSTTQYHSKEVRDFVNVIPGIDQLSTGEKGLLMSCISSFPENMTLLNRIVQHSNYKEADPAKQKVVLTAIAVLPLNDRIMVNEIAQLALSSQFPSFNASQVSKLLKTMNYFDTRSWEIAGPMINHRAMFFTHAAKDGTNLLDRMTSAMNGVHATGKQMKYDEAKIEGAITKEINKLLSAAYNQNYWERDISRP